MTQLILDDFREETTIRYAHRTVFQLCISLLLVFAPALSINLHRLSGTERETMAMYIGLAAILGLVFAAIGFINGIISCWKREPAYRKYIGVLGNGAVLVLGLLIFAADYLDFSPNLFN